MTTSVVPSNISIPAHAAARIGQASKLADSIGRGLSAGGVPRISIKGGRFRIIEEGVETVIQTLELELVIVGAGQGLSKIWFAKQWSPDEEPVQPDCFSLDGVAPDIASTTPQNTLCATCPQNAWGSRITPSGSQVKACADQKRLAVVSASDPAGPMYLLQVTPAALKGLQEYRKAITMRGIPFEIIVTRVGFDVQASFPKLTFSFSRFLSAEEQAEVDKRLGSEEAREITGERATVQTKQLSVATQPPPPAAAQPAPVAQPVTAPVAPQPAPAPAQPARGFGKAPSAAGSGSVDSLVADIEKLLQGSKQ